MHISARKKRDEEGKTTVEASTMKLKIESTKIVKPLYEDGEAPGGAGQWVPLSVFDKVTYGEHVAIIFAFRPPNPPSSEVELGLAKALAVYREWAGQIGDGPDGRRSVLLNDAGARFVEATVDAPLAVSVPSVPSPDVRRLHPRIDDGPVELVQVQLTRFSCGSMVVGFAGHHQIADGQATANFLAAWGLATRRLPVSPLPVCDRGSRFAPREPPLVEFPHREVEYKAPAPAKKHDAAYGGEDYDEAEFSAAPHDKVKVHRMHLSKEFVARLKARASSGLPPSRRGYTTFQSVVAHLWRTITAARGLGAGVTTKVRISVNGRSRMRPPVPRGHFGNVVLWAFPSSDAGDLVSRPVGHAAELICRAVAGVDDAYFRSFVDFASSGAVEAEGLVPTADSEEAVLCPNLELDAWLGINFHDMDFGTGGPFYFMPTYYPMEGSLFLVPSTTQGDGGMEAYVALFDNHLQEFKRICHNIDHLAPKTTTTPPHPHSQSHTHTTGRVNRKQSTATDLPRTHTSATDVNAPPDGSDRAVGAAAGGALGGAAAAVRGAGAGSRRDDLRGLGGGRRQQQPPGHAGARRLPALRPRLPGHPRAHRPLLQRQARHRLHRGEPGAQLVPAGVPERAGAERQQEPPPRRQLRLRRLRLPRRHRRALRRHPAGAAAGLLQGVPVQGGGGGRRQARGGAHVRVYLRAQRRDQRLRAELLRQRHARRRLQPRPVRRRAHAPLHGLRREPVRAGSEADRGDVAAAHGVPAGVGDAVRRSGRGRRLRGAAQQRLPDLQQQAAGGGGRDAEAAPGPQARRLRHLQPAAQHHRRPHELRVLRGDAGVLRDGDDRDVGAVPPGGAGDVRQRHGIRLLGRLPPHGRRKQDHRQRPAPPGPPAHLLVRPTLLAHDHSPECACVYLCL